MKKKALITGITGQDGTYLAELLSKCEYEIWGLIRRSSHSDAIERLKTIVDKVNLRYGDMTDSLSLRRIISECRPDEIYNLAAQSHVRISFDIPEYTSNVNATGVLDLLSAAKEIIPDVKVYHAATSEMFGRTLPPQNEKSPFQPTSPYGTAKLHAYWEVVNARSAGMFACNGILFNHESPRRGENFVTKKITSSVAKIKHFIIKNFKLGNLDAVRDWGFAGDYVKAMYMILQQKTPDDYVIATGKPHTVRDFLETSLKLADIPFEHVTTNDPVNERYVRKDNGETIVSIDPRLYRPVELPSLIGDASKAKQTFGWEPSVDFEKLVEMMISYDLAYYGKV